MSSVSACAMASRSPAAGLDALRLPEPPASPVRRLGAVHGLFGAFVCGCVIAIVALGAALLTLGPAPLRVQGFTAFTVTTYLNVAALVTVPAAVTASGLASWIRRAASLPDPAPARGLR